MRLKVGAAAAAMAMLFPSPAFAGTGGSAEAGSDGSTGEINANVATATVSDSPVISTCSWLVNPPISDVYPTVVRDVSTKTFDNESRTYRLYLKACPGLPDEYVYIPDVTPREVIDQAALALRQQSSSGESRSGSLRQRGGRRAHRRATHGVAADARCGRRGDRRRARRDGGGGGQPIFGIEVEGRALSATTHRALGRARPRF